QEVQDLYNAGSAGKCKTVRFYVSDIGKDTIEKFDINGVDLGTFADVSSGLSGPRGLVFDFTGNLYATDGSNSILKFDPLGNATVFADASTGLSNSYGMTFDLSGNLYVANAG